MRSHRLQVVVIPSSDHRPDSHRLLLAVEASDGVDDGGPDLAVHLQALVRQGGGEDQVGRHEGEVELFEIGLPGGGSRGQRDAGRYDPCVVTHATQAD